MDSSDDQKTNLEIERYSPDERTPIVANGYFRTRLGDETNDFGFVTELVEAIGAEATLVLLLTCGGTRIHVPSRARENHRFAQLLGHEAFTGLCEGFGGMDIHIPIGRRIKLHQDVDLFQRLLEDGASSNELAREFGVSQRTIFRKIVEYGFFRLAFETLIDVLGYERTLIFVDVFSNKFAKIVVPIDPQSEVAAIIGTAGLSLLADHLQNVHGERQSFHAMPTEAASFTARQFISVWCLAWQDYDFNQIVAETGLNFSSVTDKVEAFELLNGNYAPATLKLLSKAWRFARNTNLPPNPLKNPFNGPFNVPHRKNSHERLRNYHSCASNCRHTLWRQG